MAKMIQIRNVPEDMHRELVRRARERRLTLTRYLQEILERELARPPVDEIVDRVSARSPVELGKTAAELLREERRERRLG